MRGSTLRVADIESNPIHLDGPFGQEEFTLVNRRQRIRRAKPSLGLARLFGSRKQRWSGYKSRRQRSLHKAENHSNFAIVSPPLKRVTTIVAERRFSSSDQISIHSKTYPLTQVTLHGGRRRRGDSRYSNMFERHACGHCGRFRSASYHKRHPLAAGERPRPTICKRCAKAETSSEESLDDEFYSREYRTRRRRRSEGRSPRFSYSSRESESGQSNVTRVETIITSAPGSIISRRGSRRRSFHGLPITNHDRSSWESIDSRSQSRSRSMSRYVEIRAASTFYMPSASLNSTGDAHPVDVQGRDLMESTDSLSNAEVSHILTRNTDSEKIGGSRSPFAFLGRAPVHAGGPLVPIRAARRSLMVCGYCVLVQGHVHIAIVQVNLMRAVMIPAMVRILISRR